MTVDFELAARWKGKYVPILLHGASFLGGKTVLFLKADA